MSLSSYALSMADEEEIPPEQRREIVDAVEQWQDTITTDAAQQVAVMRLSAVFEDLPLNSADLRRRMSESLSQAARSAAAHENLGSVRSTSLVDELAKLASMLESGLLTRDEFDRLKARLLADS